MFGVLLGKANTDKLSCFLVSCKEHAKCACALPIYFDWKSHRCNIRIRKVIYLNTVSDTFKKHFRSFFRFDVYAFQMAVTKF